MLAGAAKAQRVAGAQNPTVLAGRTVTLPSASVVELLSRNATVHAQAVALEADGRSLTFRQLWDRAQAIADALGEAGVEAGDLVLLWAERTPAVVAAALGVMMLRAAYVPIDPAYPPERSQAVSAATGAALLAYDGSANGRAPVSLGVPVLDVAEARGAVGSARPELPSGHDLAYVIFTSGSTGTPKGVMVGHRALVNYTCWCAAAVGDAGIGSPLFGSLGFDHTLTSLWPTLVCGRRVVIAKGVWDLPTLFERRPPYTFMKVTPSHLRFFERTRRPPYADAVHLLMSGGEALETALLRSLGDRIAGIRLMNHYGPTETTIGCCAYAFDSAAIPPSATVPIGRPIWNTRAYLVDDDLRPIRSGPAELVIAGAGVARGYVGAVRGDAFVDERELGGPAGRAYRTGDWVELLSDGTLEYLGRTDDQTKINGHRIELAELRRHALAVPGVADVVFEVERREMDRVEAYVAPAADAEPQSLADDLRRALASVLPRAVVPQAVNVVPEIVFDVHGKADVAATRQQVPGRDA